MPRIALKLDAIPLESPVRLQHDDVAMVVIRTGSGVRAFLDRCPHAQWPLSEGEMVDGILVCPGHGWQFNSTTGQCLNSPAYHLTPLSVVVDNDDIHIEWA
jgi:nitrite reductase/ring-hydroxylating ferredoxin subunit